MITVCPKCALTLAVTAADLRTGQGQVRCGRCAAIFNALAALQDDLSETIEQARPPELSPAPEVGEPQTPSNRDAEVPQAAANDAEAAAPPPANDDLIDPVAANEELHIDVESVVQLAEPDDDVETQFSELQQEPAALDLDLTPTGAPPEAVTEAPRVARGWYWGSAALALLLAAQLLHANRETLVLRDDLRGPLQSVYGAVGMPLQPRWDAQAYDIRRQGEMLADDAGHMTLRATITNTAPHSQPLPLLRIVLQDRFGAKIAARDLQPREYLPAAVAAKLSTLTPGQRVDAEVTLADPGPAAAGFELDACLLLGPERLVCAS